VTGQYQPKVTVVVGFGCDMGMSRERVLLLLLVILIAVNLLHGAHSELRYGATSRATSAVLRSVGFVGLALSSECTATRNPVLEQICACLGDIPGSYCYHVSCAIVGIPIVGNQTDQIAIIPLP